MGAGDRGSIGRLGPFVGTVGAVGGLFEPGDDVGRAWDEAEAILLACDDLDAVMVAIRDADSPVEARRALKVGFGFTGRQAALLLTLPVLSFTRSERARMHEGQRARMELMADVTGVFPAIREPVAADPLAPTAPEREACVAPAPEPEAVVAPAPQFVSETPVFHESPAATEEWYATESTPGMSEWGDEFDGTVDRMRSVMDQHYGVAPSPSLGEESAPSLSVVPAPPSGDPEEPVRRLRRSAEPVVDETATILDEQIGELCDAIAAMLQVGSSSTGWLDDPRDSGSPTGQLLDSCGLDDATGIRTLLWHLRRTGLDSVDGFLPFAEPLSGSRGFDVQAARFETAMAAGSLGAEPAGGATWTGRLWPIAEKLGYGYAVHYRPGPGAGAVWAYGGGEPLHLLWDSVVDMLVELYQAFAAGEPCDAALAAVVDGRVVWTNLS